MAETLHCKRCGGDNPADARFCIDCGATLAPAATSDTTRLPGMRCPSCATNNPEHARFCVVCGRGLVAGAIPTSRPAPQPRPVLQPRPPAMPPGPKAGPPHSPRQHSFPRVAAPPVVLPVAPRPPVIRTYRSARSVRANGPLLFGIGLLILIITGNIWPGILWLIGLSGFVGAMTHGRANKAFQALLWWGGLAILFATGTFWPGILLLVLFSMALGGHGRGKPGCW